MTLHAISPLHVHVNTIQAISRRKKGAHRLAIRILSNSSLCSGSAIAVRSANILVE